MDVIAATHAFGVSIQQAYQVIYGLNLLSYIYPDEEPISEIPQEYDAIIVGAGTAGSVISARLAEAKFNVLVIEAGGNPSIENQYPSQFLYAPGSHLDWQYVNQDPRCTEKCHAKRIHLNRGKVVGGTGSNNGMLYIRGTPHDYNVWADIVNDTNWGWDALLPYFKKTEDVLDADIRNSSFGKYYGTGGPMKLTRQVHKELNGYLEGFKEFGYNSILDTSSNDNLGFWQLLYYIHENKRWSTAYAYLPKMKGNPNFHILKNTLVTKITFDESGKANGVEAMTQDGKTLNFRASKEVIMAAGVFNTPKILMLSGIGPKDHLSSLGIQVRADLPVGKNLQDQLAMYMSISSDKAKSPKLPPLPSTTFPGYLLTGNLALNKSQTHPDYQAFIFGYPNETQGLTYLCSYLFHLENSTCRQIHEVSKNRNVLLTVLLATRLKSRGYVHLNSTDPTDKPYITLGTFTVEEDIDTVTSYVENFIQVTNTTYFKSIDAKVVEFDIPECMDKLKGSREYWKCYVENMWITEYHYVGTCALGSVVQTTDFQVIGVPGLRIADSSIIPSTGSNRPNAVTTAIAERFVEFFIDKYGH